MQAWPFLGGEALASGVLTERALRRDYIAVYPGVWVPRDLKDGAFTARHRAIAAWLWTKRRGVLAGFSAAALHGAKWIDPSLPAELVHDNHSSPPGLRVYRDVLLAGEMTTICGIPVTTAARTAFDLGRRVRGRIPAVQCIDALANATGVKTVDIEAVADAHRGARDIRRLRRLLPLVDGGAESPQETRTRLTVIDHGLPAPETQIVVLDEHGGFIARVDMGYREVKVGIEYDGPQHWTDPVQRARDIERHEALLAAGWRIIRVDANLLRRPAVLVDRVHAALAARRAVA